MGCDRGRLVQRVGGQKVRRREFGGMEEEGEKDLMGSGVEYCGTYLNGVREVIGVWSWVYINGGIANK